MERQEIIKKLYDIQSVVLTMLPHDGKSAILKKITRGICIAGTKATPDKTAKLILIGIDAEYNKFFNGYQAKHGKKDAERISK